MFSIATNNYDRIYKDNILSHRKYADKYGYRYILFDHPKKRISASDSAWMKIPLILHGLQRGYNWLFFVDADCRISLGAPGILTLERPGKYIYMTLGRSNRINSGMFIIKNCNQAKEAFKTIMDHVDEDAIPKQDVALYENGHVIHYLKENKYLEVLDRKWNDNTGNCSNIYILHQRKKEAFFFTLVKKFYSRVFSRILYIAPKEKRSIRLSRFLEHYKRLYF
jgi:hypothetical protein